jgi:3-hydroxyanthranilate 3,4-dioxygenase
MVVAGPNARKDYHYNEELFYQLEGSIKLSFKKMESRNGIECRRYVPSRKTPHSPVRSEGSIGFIERKRAGQGFVDGLLWFCDNCNHKLHEVYFELNDIEKDFLLRTLLRL